MRTRKVRGHKRRWKQIEEWKNTNLNLDLKYLTEYERDYIKIRVHPWSGLSLRNSSYPEPKGQSKQKILNGLFDIYEEWKKKLEEFEKPYYLKIWLYDNRFSMSQVVCAVGNYIDFYDNTFNKTENREQIDFGNYGSNIRNRVELFNWESHLDEDHFDNTELGKPDDYETIEVYLESKKWFEKLMKKPHNTVKHKEPIGDTLESYLFEKGKIWIGEIK